MKSNSFILMSPLFHFRLETVKSSSFILMSSLFDFRLDTVNLKLESLRSMKSAAVMYSTSEVRTQRNKCIEVILGENLSKMAPSVSFIEHPPSALFYFDGSPRFTSMH